MMSPWGILAVLAILRRFMTFLQLRRVHLCLPGLVIIGWFLSLWSLRGPFRSLRDLAKRIPADRLRQRPGQQRDPASSNLRGALAGKAPRRAPHAQRARTVIR